LRASFGFFLVFDRELFSRSNQDHPWALHVFVFMSDTVYLTQRSQDKKNLTAVKKSYSSVASEYTQKVKQIILQNRKFFRKKSKKKDIGQSSL